MAGFEDILRKWRAVFPHLNDDGLRADEIEALEDMERELNRAVFTHLSEEELGAYYNDTLSEGTRVRVDAHLKRCLICNRRLVTMKEVLDPPEPDGHESQEKVLSDLRKFLRQASDRDGLVGQPRDLQESTSRYYAVDYFATLRCFSESELVTPNFPAPRKYDGQMEDGSLRWNGAEDAKTGNLVIRFRFASRKMILTKGTLLVSLGNLTRRVWLKEVGNNRWRGEIIFTRQERSDLPDDAEFSVALAE